MNTEGYPTEEELSEIRSWPYNDFEGLLDFIESECWWTPSFGFKREGETLYLHTGGWSGNEEIISALMDNTFFWMFCWEESKRGGHYKFRIRPQSPKNEEG